jgi:hypothetical protein
MAAADNEAYEYYADPKNQVPAGPGRSRTTKSTHVPIRFTPEMIADVKQLADKDRKTVSSWVRDVVAAEVKRRRPHWPQSVVSSTSSSNWTVVAPSGAITSQPLTVPSMKTAELV